MPHRPTGWSSPIPTGGPTFSPSLDSLTQTGLRTGDPDIPRGAAWFTTHQDTSGLWNTGHSRPKHPDSELWVGLVICRMLNAADEGR